MRKYRTSSKYATNTCPLFRIYTPLSPSVPVFPDPIIRVRHHHRTGKLIYSSWRPRNRIETGNSPCDYVPSPEPRPPTSSDYARLSKCRNVAPVARAEKYQHLFPQCDGSRLARVIIPTMCTKRTANHHNPGTSPQNQLVLKQVCRRRSCPRGVSIIL